MCLTLAYVVLRIPIVTYATSIDSAKIKERRKREGEIKKKCKKSTSSLSPYENYKKLLTYSLQIECDTTTKSNLENINDNIIQLNVHLDWKYKSLTKNSIVCVFLEFNVVTNTVSLD